MAHDGRRGLATYPTADGVIPGYRDAAQWIEHGLAVARVVAERLGGEGIYTGGGDPVTSGTQYPAVGLIVYDDGGEAWYFRTSAARDIEFPETTGETALYAVIETADGVTPAMATGGRLGVRFVAQASGDPAPANSLLLGTGTVAEGAFTDYTEAEGVRLHSVVTDDIADGAVTYAKMQDVSATDRILGRATAGAGVVEEIACTAAARALLDDADAATQRATLGLGAADSPTLTGLTLTNGKLLIATDTKFGPPVSGTYSTGQWWLDLAGSLWRCTAGGSPGTWVQHHHGRATTWTGGGSSDITASGNWNGGALLDGYRVWDGSDEWRYSTTYARWIGRRFILPLPTFGGSSPVSATTSNLLLAMIDQSAYDLAVYSCSIRSACATADASNYWTIDLRNASGTLLNTVVKNTASTSYQTITPSSGNVVQAYTNRSISITVTTTGSPSALSIGADLLCALVRR